jgi:hypothetical protein
MTAEIINYDDEELTIQVKVKITGSLFEAELTILDACNKVGILATSQAIKKFDTDGSSIQVAGVKLTAKQPIPKIYQTPYGAVEVPRYVYQTSKGGRTYCPLEQNARIIRSATPRFAQQISHKYANMNAPAVCADLEDNHHRKIAHSYLQDVADHVGAIASAKEEAWEYVTPQLDATVTSITISMDGAYLLMREDGYREAMVGAISLYNPKGDRLHSIYIGEAPEYGKATFTERLKQEIARIKKQYPDALYLGIADGAKNNWSFLEQHTNCQLLDFFHATEYLADVAQAAFPGKTDKPKREAWLHERCKQLKHEAGKVDEIITEMEKFAKRTNYADHVAKELPIGSGVTEAACKTLVKQRLCCSGMRWKLQGAKVILSLRALIQSKGRWEQFWDKIDQFGAQICV